MDSPKEKATLSMILICRKKIKVQAKPGAKNTNTKPSVALMMGKLSRKGKMNPKIPPIGDNQSTPYLPFYKYSTWSNSEGA